jgi:UTP--glucose-1-phosphate uridylyltransferase
MEILKAQLPKAGTTSFTRQQEPLGLGHAVWCARDIVGDEPFALILPDMLHQAKRSCLAEMIEVYEEAGGGNVVSVYEVPDDQTHQYGIVGAGEKVGKGFRMTSMVEKPKKGTAQSNLAISGRYILQPEIFGLIEKQEPGAGGEIQITDSMLTLAKSQTFSGFAFKGRVFDTGSKLGFLAANVAYGLARDEIAGELRQEIEGLLKG